MFLKRFALAVVLAIAGYTQASSTAQADCNCIDNLAHQLMPQIRQMERQYVATFRGSRQFNHGLNDVKQVADLAAHFHETAHQGGSSTHLRSDIEKLDRAYHHLESVVSRMERDAIRGAQAFRATLANVGATIHKIEDTLVHGCGCGTPGRMPVPGATHGRNLGHGPMTAPQHGINAANERFGFRFNQ